MSGTLYIVGTPIGNVGDMTARGTETLRAVDFIYAEDTRHTRPLMDRCDIKKPLRSYHKFSERETSAEIVAELRAGKNIALVTDAGMPCISDPGAVLIRVAREEGMTVTAVPGPTAVTTAAALSGMCEKGFAFYGFLPERKKDRDALIAEISRLSVSVILYSAPHDVLNDLKYLFEQLGTRRVFVIKEITKMFETVYEGSLGEIEISDTRGEFVFVIAPSEAKKDFSDLAVREHVQNYIDGGLSKKDAIKQTATDRGVHKSEIYKEVIE